MEKNYMAMAGPECKLNETTLADTLNVAPAYVPVFEHKTLSHQPSVSRYSRSAISQTVKACKTTEEALFILSDETLYKRCRIWELLKLTALHPDMAKAAMNTPLFKKFPFFLRKLAAKHVSLAHYLLDTEEFAQKRHALAQVKLAKKHPEIAMRLLTTQKFLDNFQGYELAGIGEFHLEAATMIVNNQDLFEKILGAHLTTLIHNHPSLILDLLKRPAFRKHLSTCGLQILGKLDEKVALDILDNPPYDLSANDLIQLSRSAESIAWRILRSETYLPKLKNSYILSRFGAFHSNIALHILQTPGLCDLIEGQDLPFIARYHAVVAQFIFDSPKLRQTILNTEKRSQFLSTEFIANRKGDSLRQMGSSNKETARKIVTTPSLYNDFELTALDFGVLGQFDEDTAFVILNNPTLRDKLDGHCLMLLGEHSFSVADYILNEKALSSRLDGHHLAQLAQNHAEIALRILQSEELVSRLDSNHFLSLLRFGNSNKMFLSSIHLELTEYALSQPNLKCKMVHEGSGCSMTPISNDEITQVFKDILELGATLHHIAKAIKARQIHGDEVDALSENLKETRLTPFPLFRTG